MLTKEERKNLDAKFALLAQRIRSEERAKDYDTMVKRAVKTDEARDAYFAYLDRITES